jgi:hypothetical protein
MCHAEQALAEQENGSESAGSLTGVLISLIKEPSYVPAPVGKLVGVVPMKECGAMQQLYKNGSLHLNVYPESDFALNVLYCCGLCMGCKGKSGLTRAHSVQSTIFHASHVSSNDLSPMFQHSATQFERA